MSKSSKLHLSAVHAANLKKAAVAVGLLAAPALALAGAGGSEFDGVYTTLTDWSQGTLGKIISLGMILTGIGMGVVRQSVAAIVVGIAGGLALFNAPTVLDGIVGASL